MSREFFGADNDTTYINGVEAEYDDEAEMWFAVGTGEVVGYYGEGEPLEHAPM